MVTRTHVNFNQTCRSGGVTQRVVVVKPQKKHTEKDEMEFQNHYAHEKEIYMGLLSSEDEESDDDATATEKH